MHTMIRPPQSQAASPAFTRSSAWRRPHYDCQDQTGMLKLRVYVPGVQPSAIGIEVDGPDLVVTAPKARAVRANWRALQLEHAQRDYQLRLRLGYSLDYAALKAALRGGVLTVTIPKKAMVVAAR